MSAELEHDKRTFDESAAVNSARSKILRHQNQRSVRFRARCPRDDQPIVEPTPVTLSNV